MPAGTKWLNLTLPVAAFLGSAAGSVAVQRSLPPPTLSLPPGVVALAAPVQVPPGVPVQPAPPSIPPSDGDSSGPGPDVPGPADVNLPPPPLPAGSAPTDDGVDAELTSQLQASVDEWDRDGNAPLPPGYFDLPPAPTGPNAPPILQPGLIIQVEVLEALPGCPINGQYLIRGDGTIGLTFYGDVPVAGLNRHQAKIRLLEHLRKYLTVSVLGLRFIGPDGKAKTIPPVESDRVFIYDSLYIDPKTAQPVPPAADSIPVGLREEVRALGTKLDEVLKQADRSVTMGTSLRTPERPAAGPEGKEASPADNLPEPGDPIAPPPAPSPARAKPSA